MSKGTETRTPFQSSAAAFMALGCFISLLAISGWLFNQPILASLNPEFIPMAPSTGLIFLGLYGAFFIFRVYSARRGIRILVQTAQVGMLVIVIILALKYFTGLGPDLEQLLLPHPILLGQIETARISPLTALGFLLAIPAFLLLTGQAPGTRNKNAASILSLVVLILSSINILGYIYGAPPFYGGTLIPVALTTALSFFFLSLGLMLSAGPTCWPVSFFVGPSLKARLMRTFMPAAFIIVLLEGLLSTFSAPWIINPAVRVAFAAFAAGMIVFLIISLIANNLSKEIERKDQARIQAESAFNQSEASLKAVLQSTADGILAVGIENEVLYANERFAELWRIPEVVMASKDDSILLNHILYQLNDPQDFLKNVQELYKSKEESFDILHFKDGRVFERLSRPLMRGDENRGRVWSFRDVTESNALEEKLEKERILLRTLVDNIPDRIYGMDAQGRKILSNQADWQASGAKSMDEIIGKTDLDTYPPELAEKFWADNMDVIGSGISILNREEPGLDFKGNPVTVLSSKVPLRDVQGNIAGLVGIGRDITERKEAEQLQDAIYRIAQAADISNSLDSLYLSIHSIVREVMVADNFYLALYDEKNELISFPYSVDEQDPEFSTKKPGKGLTEYILRTGKTVLCNESLYEELIQRAEIELVGAHSPIWLGVPLIVEGKTIGVMVVQDYKNARAYGEREKRILEFVSTQVARAIEHKRLEEEIRSLSLTDELTGLYNRRGFTLLAEQEVKLAQRMKRDMLLFFGDMDNLKTINDSLGHVQGDQALKQVAAILKQNFRESDIVARIGGDEFVVLAVDAFKDNGEIIVNRIQASLDTLDLQEGWSYHPGISLGFARYDPDDPSTVRELIAEADSKMYLQKQARKSKG